MPAPWINLLPSPVKDLVQEKPGDVWRSTGGHPEFLLVPASGAAIRKGWCELELDLEFLQNARRPRLYWDDDAGHEKPGSALLPLPEGGVIRKFLYFSQAPAWLRLDPSDCESRFRIKQMRVRSTSRYAAAWRLCQPSLAKAAARPGTYARFARDLGLLWLKKGAPEIRAALRVLLTTQNPAAVRNFVTVQLTQAGQTSSRREQRPQAALTASALRSFKGERKQLRIGIGLVEHFGDIVACEPVARYLRKQYKDAEICWVVRDSFRELVDHNPNVDRTIAVDCLTDWIKWRSHNVFDLVVDLHVNERICQQCRIPLHKPEGNPRITGESHLEHGSLLRAFCLAAGLPPLDDAPRVYIPEAVARTVDALQLPERYVAVHAVSNSEGKDWDPEKWSAFAQHVAAELGLPVVELGLAPALPAGAPGVIDLCGQTRLLQTAEVIRRAAAFVGVDSGPAHFANALATPSVVLLGQLAQFERYNPFSGDFGKERNVTIVRNETGPAALIPEAQVFGALKARLAAPGGGRESPVALAVVARAQAADRRDADPRTIAFYLPQFHPIPENDAAWGKGFTEWRNVGRSRPFFEGQDQPRVPGELGYYDLRLPGILEQQAALAREHGIHGFCYYFYWFHGRRPLYLPLEDMLARRRPDFPFCYCWANENWTRRWDGMDNEIILGQNHTPEDDLKFIRFILPALEDPRYIRVDGKPLLLVYRTELFPDPARTAELWRSEARAAGLGDLYLVRCQGFDPFTDPRSIGYDAGYEVPLFILPDELRYAEVKSLNVSREFKGRIFDYAKIVDYYCRREEAPFKRYRGPMLAWDNTPRHGANATVFHGVTAELYGRWVADSLAHARRSFAGEERLLFINAWNEWAEGSYLEPDLKRGRAFLEATAAAIRADRELGRSSPAARTAVTRAA